jgi:type IV secretion system protein VirD4
MIAVLCLLVLAVAAAKATGAEAAAHAHNVLAGFLAAGLVLLTAAPLAGWFVSPGRRLPRNRVRRMRIRLRLGLRPGQGHATAFGLWFRWGRWAAFRRSRRARPSLGIWRRYWCPFTHAVLLGWAYGWHRLWVPSEEHVLVMAPPRKFKTALLGKAIMHWPGAAVATSTKPDLFGLTSGLRARRGPVHVFNPQRRGGVPSTFRWNPLQGCEEPAVAIRRASAFTEAVDQAGVEKGDWFGERAGAYLRALFCAAALGGHDMLTVARWASGMEITAAQEILHRHGRQEWVRELDQLHGQARRTIESIQMTMAAALGFLADPGLQECVLPGSGEIDLPGFLTGGGTLYLIARKQGKTAPLGPLFAAIASEVQYQAVLLGSMQPGGRLDPPLLLALDEATAICPVPVPSWLSDAGGQGVSLIVVCHSEAQLRTSWGADGAQVVMDTCGTVAWFAGIKDTNTLETASKLCDETSYLQRGQEHETQHPVLTPGMIYQLPPKYALIMRGGLSPVIAHAPIGWHDLGYLLARIRGQAVAPVRALAQLQRAAPRQAVPPVDRWAPADHTPAAPEPAGASNGPAAPGRLPWDTPVDGNGTNGDRTPAGEGHDGH